MKTTRLQSAILNCGKDLDILVDSWISQEMDGEEEEEEQEQQGIREGGKKYLLSLWSKSMVRGTSSLPPIVKLFILFMLLPFYYEPESRDDELFIKVLRDSPKLFRLDLKQYVESCVLIYLTTSFDLEWRILSHTSLILRNILD